MRQDRANLKSGKSDQGVFTSKSLDAQQGHDRHHIFAHSAPDDHPFEPLYTGLCGPDCEKCQKFDPDHGHLNKVAFWTGRFAAEMFSDGSNAGQAASEWGRLTGLWHDLGKFSPDFQALLRGEVLRTNHSTAGAQHAFRAIPQGGQLLAYLIAGHHAGLTDLLNGNSSLSARLNGDDYCKDLSSGATPLLTKPTLPPLPIPCQRHTIAFFTRLLFSCLVDADFLATEAFMNPAQADRRQPWPDDILALMEEALDVRYSEFDPDISDINRRRGTVHADCLRAAEKEPGLFTLTVPTGGGKTLASLAFALRHARKHGLRRVIYVVPYTSIIEQNADEFRKTFSELSRELNRDIVLEHHANFESPDDDTESDEKPLWKLTAENWDAPLVVTTSVQFFDSLYSNRTSRCRKLHRIARSVIIFDEAQNLPPDLLAPCLETLRQLTNHFGTTAVLCTATQPAIGRLPPDTPGNFATAFNEIALDIPTDSSREIIRDVTSLYAGLQRVTVSDLGILSDEDLAAELLKHERVLCILNTKRHAARIFDLLGSGDPTNLHLSAQLCPAHRRTVLAEIRCREKRGAPCRLIATTVVEAGVDLDFPVVFRALTGLDSLAQAAGRCNRHGDLGSHGGQVFVFTSADQKTPSFLSQNVNATLGVIPDHRDDLLAPSAIENYFRQYYFERGNWDKPEIRDCFKIANDSPTFPFAFNFKKAAKEFQLIPDTQAPVIVPPNPQLWLGQDEPRSAQICALLEQIRDSDRKKYPPPRDAHRKLQSYTVQIPKNIHAAMVSAGLVQLYCDDRFPILVHPENDYDPKLGLLIPDHLARSDAFII